MFICLLHRKNCWSFLSLPKLRNHLSRNSVNQCLSFIFDKVIDANTLWVQFKAPFVNAEIKKKRLYHVWLHSSCVLSVPCERCSKTQVYGPSLWAISHLKRSFIFNIRREMEDRGKDKRKRWRERSWLEMFTNCEAKGVKSSFEKCFWYVCKAFVGNVIASVVRQPPYH